MITLTVGATTVTLPADMLWADEFTWRYITQTVEPTLTGGMIIETAERLNGREFTLQSGEDFAWITHAQLTQLNTWANNAGQQMTLVIRGQTYTVVFRHQDQAIEASMVLYHAAPTSGDYYRCTIRLMEV